MSELREFRPLEVLIPLLKKWPLILLCTLIGGTVGFLSLRYDPPRFESKALLLVSKENDAQGDLFTLASRLGMGGGASGDITGVYDQVLKSVTFTSRLADMKFPRGAQATPSGFESEYELPNRRDSLAYLMAINGSLTGSRGFTWKVKAGGTIELTYQSRDPYFAAAVVDSILKQLELYTIESRRKGVEKRLRVTTTNLDYVAFGLDSAERRVSSFQRANFGLSPALTLEQTRLQRESQVLEQVYSTLRQSKATLEVERGSVLSPIQVIDAPLPALYPVIRPLRKWIVVGAFLGGLFGFAAAVVYHTWQQRRRQRS